MKRTIARAELATGPSAELKRTIARAVLVVLVPLLVGNPLGGATRSLPEVWLDGAIPLGLAGLIAWAVRQLAPPPPAAEQ